MPTTETELLARASAGDAEALTDLLRRHAPELRSSIAARIGPAWRRLIDADDVLQVTFVEAFLRIRDFRPTGDGAFRAWLGTMARSSLAHALRGLRAQKRGGNWNRVGAAAQGGDAATTLIGRIAGTEGTPSKNFRIDEAVRLLQEALDKLPTDYRAVLQAYDLENEPIEKIAERMKKSTGALFMIRARALARLRELLPIDALTTGLTVTGR